MELPPLPPRGRSNSLFAPSRNWPKLPAKKASQNKQGQNRNRPKFKRLTESESRVSEEKVKIICFVFLANFFVLGHTLGNLDLKQNEPEENRAQFMGKPVGQPSGPSYKTEIVLFIRTVITGTLQNENISIHCKNLCSRN